MPLKTVHSALYKGRFGHTARNNKPKQNSTKNPIQSDKEAKQQQKAQ